MKMYIYRMNILIEGEENLQLEAELDQALVSIATGGKVELVSATIEDIVGTNYGKCVGCGCWVTDLKKPDPVLCFSPGKEEKTGWMCDLCLPPHHPDAF